MFKYSQSCPVRVHLHLQKHIALQTDVWASALRH